MTLTHHKTTVILCLYVCVCASVYHGGGGWGGCGNWGRDEEEWDAADKGEVVYSGNSCLSLEPAHLFSRVSDLVCVFMRKNVHLN